MKRRVVITGMGICTGVGCGVGSFWDNLKAGRSGISPVSVFDASALPVRIGGEVKDLQVARLAARFPEAAGERERKIWLGLDAASQAITDAGAVGTDFGNTPLFVGVSLETFFLQDVSSLARPQQLAAATQSSATFPLTPPLSLGEREDYGSAGTHSLRCDSSKAAETLSLSPRERVRVRGNSASDCLHTGWGRSLRELLDKHDAPHLQTPLDRLTDILGDHYGLNGGRYTNCSACAAGTQAVGEAFRRIRDGTAEAAVAGASDSVLNPLAMGGFSLLQILSTEYEAPERACRPFDATRQGTVLGEGAAFVVMETLEQAQRRGARVYAEVLGYGTSLDAHRLTDPEPNGKGAVLSISRALADAGLEAGAIDCVNAHGTGTPKNDVAETRAIKQALQTRAYEIPITANKSMTGHLIAASGAVEAVASALTLHTGEVPPTINMSQRDPECDLDYVPNAGRKFEGRTVLSNSFGFGGQNASLVFGKLTL